MKSLVIEFGGQFAPSTQPVGFGIPVAFRLMALVGVSAASCLQGRTSCAIRLMLMRWRGVMLSELIEPLQVPVPSMKEGSKAAL